MLKKVFYYSIVSSLFSAYFIYSKGLDPIAIAKTAKLFLNNPKMAQAMDGSQGANEPEQLMKDLGMSPEQIQEIHKMVSVVAEKMIEENNGNTHVSKLLKDSPQLQESLTTEEQLKQIRKLASEIDKKYKNKPTE